jgi:hypothetical protein
VALTVALLVIATQYVIEGRVSLHVLNYAIPISIGVYYFGIKEGFQNATFDVSGNVMGSKDTVRQRVGKYRLVVAFIGVVFIVMFFITDFSRPLWKPQTSYIIGAIACFSLERLLLPVSQVSQDVSKNREK